ncbi:MAG: c-type cytochrome [Candidatus Sulfotelmatobacter sp.]|nr:c-type cytochrome [Candidatus Sulfotelmatobacter sp.]
MKRERLVVIVGAVTVLFALFAIVSGSARAQSGAATNTANPKRAEEQFKNIQVLKGIPADQLIPSMQFITASLGVGCEFCHVEGSFEKDDKKTKQTARKMMEMMFAINKDNFEGHREVTCYSCHRGAANPVGMPPIISEEAKLGAVDGKKAAEKMGENDAELREAAGPPPNQLFEKYLQSVGGAAAIEKIKTREMKGTITFGDSNVPIEIFSKDPDKRISFTHTPDGDSVTAFDGHEGWLSFPGRPARQMHGPDIDAAAMDANLHFAINLKEMFTEAHVLGTEKIGEHNAYLVVGAREAKTPLRLYFDEQSGLLLRLVRFAETPLGRLPTQIDYADYREAGGIKVPFRWTLARPGGRFTIQINQMKENVPVDDAKFARPPTPTVEPKAPAK